MKHIFASVLLLVVAVSISSVVAAKDERKSPHETVKSGNVSITYGRPYKKGREVFGKLVPFGEVWRTGADEATEITFKKDAVVNGSPIKAGTYTLFTIPQQDRWDIIFNSKLKQWGAFDYNKANDVMRTQAQIRTADKPVEQFTISLKGDLIMMEWDKTSVAIPFNTK